MIGLLKRYGVKKVLLFGYSELYARLWRYSVLRSYSQNGEDVELDRLTGNKKRGFYVDIGAYDPYRFSNTMRFYRKGWKGINIEPDSERFKRFVSKREKDINLNIGIANTGGNLTYFAMDPATLSTFSRTQAREYEKKGFTVKEVKKIPVLPLKKVLAKYAKKIHIDFLSLDVEGFEMDVLKSNDWKRFRPTFLCIETAVGGKRTIHNFLLNVDYKIVSDNGLNSFYKSSAQK